MRGSLREEAACRLCSRRRRRHGEIHDDLRFAAPPVRTALDGRRRRLPAVVGPVGCAMSWSSSHCRAGVEHHGPTQRGSRSSTNLTRSVDTSCWRGAVARSKSIVSRPQVLGRSDVIHRACADGPAYLYPSQHAQSMGAGCLGVLPRRERVQRLRQGRASGAAVFDGPKSPVGPDVVVRRAGHCAFTGHASNAQGCSRVHPLLSWGGEQRPSSC